MPLPYVERKVQPTLPPSPSGMRNLDAAIAVYRALVEQDNHPTLERLGNGKFQITLALAEQVLVSQMVEMEDIARKAHPDVQCLVEDHVLIIR